MNVYTKHCELKINNASYNDIKEIVSENVKQSENIVKGSGRRKSKICLIGCGFDIETTKISENKTFMYHWQFSINETVITGRKWNEFISLVNIINNKLKTINAHCYIFVANLGYEFQFMRKHFEISDLFAR